MSLVPVSTFEVAPDAFELARPGPKPIPLEYRIIRRTITDANGCWIWQGAIGRNGYARITINGRNELLHRVAWELFNQRPIPDGLQIDHLCFNKACCNPSHLEPVTMAENCRRAMSTHCTHGHEYTPENTYTWPSGKGRECRICRRARKAAFNRRNRKP